MLMLQSKSSKENLECRICGDVARGLNFDVMSCMSCKAFFRRNAFKNLVCVFGNKCSITKHTRFCCPACRLKKCLELGMNSHLIRVIPKSRSIQRPTKQIALATPKPLNLLQNDRSTLSTQEWNLVSNCIQIFDNQNIRERFDNYFNYLCSLPAKLRSRRADLDQAFSQFYYGIQTLIERTPDFHTLSTQARRVVAQHNLYLTGTVNGQFSCRELDFYSNPSFSNACIVHYGQKVFVDTIRVSSRCDSNGNLLKIFLFAIIFSSNLSIVMYNKEETIISSEEISLNLMRTQSIYVTILWKYFLYLYDYKQAVIRYANLVKYFLDVLGQLERLEQNDAHDLLIETVTTKIEHELVVED